VTPSRRRLVRATVLFVLIVGVFLVVRNQVKVYRSRQRAAAELQHRQAMAGAELQQRQTLFDLLRPVALSNCTLERFGETNDGGYLMCGNLLRSVQAGYSYGISGYDKWGCDISTKRRVRLHQYDCFNTAVPACPTGDTVFHPECVGPSTATTDGKLFDTIANQIVKNGDRGKRIALKIDVEGAEWDSFLHASDEVFQQIDQMAVEFHWVQDEKYQRVVERLKRFFHVAHIHFNNMGCLDGLAPFTSWAYEVLFVNKRIAIVDPSRTVSRLHALDARNNPAWPDCQPVPGQPVP
jgi:hypothetical protein